LRDFGDFADEAGGGAAAEAGECPAISSRDPQGGKCGLGTSADPLQTSTQFQRKQCPYSAA